MGQLKEGERVPAGFSDDAVTDRLVKPPGDDRSQQHPGVRIGQSPNCQLGNVGEVPPARSRVPKMTATDSVSSRRATNASAWAEV